MHKRFAPDFSGQGVVCPYCGSRETELFSLFGQQLLTRQYYCSTCHTPFEHVRDDDARLDKQESARIAPQSSDE